MPPAYLFLFAAAVFGSIAGSFLNALLFRFNTGRSVLVLSLGASGRSRCMHCGHVLAASDLVPVFSFLFLRGKCRYCGSRLSWQYPLVELTAAVLSAGIYALYPQPLAYAFWFVVWMTLLFVVVYDLRHKIIPWSCSIVLAVLALSSLFFSFSTGQFGTPGLWALLAGPLLAAPLLLLSAVSGGRWMGWGDGALELSIGWLLGISAGATAFILAFWSGALVGLLLMAFNSRVRMDSEVPFAPFLILGAGLALFFHVDFFSSISMLW